jgi:hypothetical protein
MTKETEFKYIKDVKDIISWSRDSNVLLELAYQLKRIADNLEEGL